MHRFLLRERFPDKGDGWFYPRSLDEDPTALSLAFDAIADYMAENEKPK
jgi:hypothetical protein